MNKAIEITKEEADRILFVEGNRGNYQRKRLVCSWDDRWYDVRKLTDEEAFKFYEELTGDSIYRPRRK